MGMADDMGPDTVHCTVKSFTGDAIIFHAAGRRDGFRWRPLRLNMPVRSMDQIVTSKTSEAWFETPDGTTVKLGECGYLCAGLHAAGWEELPRDYVINSHTGAYRIYAFVGDAAIRLKDVQGWTTYAAPRRRASEPCSIWENIRKLWRNDRALESIKFETPTAVLGIRG